MLLLASSAFAQTPLGSSIGVGGFFMNLKTEEATGTQRLSGFGAGGDATISYGRLGLGIRYLEGSLNPGGAGTGKDVVEGEVVLSVRALSWLKISLGPHIRSLIVQEGTERWLFWEGRLQTKARLATPRLTSVFELRQVLSANVDAADPFDGGQGLEGALRWEISSLPIWLGLGYRIDRSSLGDGSRTEVMEHVLISVGFGRGAH
jgi:hypothetical protein